MNIKKWSIGHLMLNEIRDNLLLFEGKTGFNLAKMF